MGVFPHLIYLKKKYLKKTFPWPYLSPEISDYQSPYLHCALGRSELCWNFSSTAKDVSDIYRFFNRKWVLAMCSFGIC